MTEVAFIEIAFSCLDLPMETNGRAPNTFAAIHCFNQPETGGWRAYANTEVVEVTLDMVLVNFEITLHE